MRSRAARLTAGALALLALGSAAAFIVYTERATVRQLGALRAFDLHAREAADAVADLRAAQEAYVAAGQGLPYWTHKVSATRDAVQRRVGDLRASTTTAATIASLDEAGATLTELAMLDKRVRDYISGGQALMAGDVIFTEASQTAILAARYIESARLSEQQAYDAAAVGRRRLEAIALSGMAAIVAVIVLLLAPRPRALEPDAPAEIGLGLSAVADDLRLNAIPSRELLPQSATYSARAVSPILRRAAQLCTEFGRVTSLAELTSLLARAANMLDATGLVVWLGSPGGSELRPVLAHGYSPQALARMPTVPRSADNAAAAAYRSGSLQIVLSRPGAPAGAVVAPLLGPDGCIGALSAEIASGGEGTESVQALAELFAAQLAAVLAPPQEEAVQQKAAGTA